MNIGHNEAKFEDESRERGGVAARGERTAWSPKFWRFFGSAIDLIMLAKSSSLLPRYTILCLHQSIYFPK